MNKKEKKKLKSDLKQSAKYCGLVVFGMFWAVVILYYAFTSIGAQINTHVGCDGIELFYTNTSFLKDAYNITEAGDGLMGYPAYTPRVLHDEHIGDCKTFSNAIYCLGKLYNVTCSFYTLVKYDPSEHYDNFVAGEGLQEKLGFIGHLGVTCKYEGSWIPLY